LFTGATEALSRAENCNDDHWQKFHFATAATYKEWALQMKPLVSIQARIDEKVSTLRRHFNLPPLRHETGHKPDACEPENVSTGSQT
jgi:hypothetical protein